MILNPGQNEAVHHNEGPALVIAGAGTGKTRVITERIATILEKNWATPGEILALTFTEKAAGEMEARVDERLPIGHEPIAISTFHAFCERLLRRFGVDIGLSPSFKILEGVTQWKFMKDHLFEFELDYYRPLGNPNKFIDQLVAHFGTIKEEMITPEAYLEFATSQRENAASESEHIEADRILELANAFAFYESLLHQNNVQDFSGLQYQVIQLLKKRPNILKYLQKSYKYILVDEYQDTNIAQNFIVDQLAASHQNLMVVGDDDQSIYKFRGAAISNILEFTQKYPTAKKIVLNQNYRSNQAILDYAYTSIQKNNPDRLEIKADIDKKLHGQTAGDSNAVSLVHCSTVDQEVQYVLEQIKQLTVPLSEVAILCRANHYALPFVDAFKKHNIPYQFLSERGLYSKEEVKDLIALLRTLANPTDNMSLVRVLKMDCFNISMLRILEVLQASKKSYHTLWHHIQNQEGFKQAYELIVTLIEYSKHHTAGETLYQFTESIDLYKTLLSNQTIESEEKIVNIATFFQKIKQFESRNESATVLDFVNYLDLAEEAGENPAANFDVDGIDGVQISSIHASKGLEFDTVFLPSLVSRRFPADNRKNGIPLPEALIKERLNEGNSHIQEERRLFYVAVTRAKNKLHLLHSDFYSSSSAKNPRAKKPSLFIKEIEDEVNILTIEKKIDGVERFIKPDQIEKGGVINQNTEYHQPILSL